MASGYHIEQGKTFHHCSKFYCTALSPEKPSMEILYLTSRKKPPLIRGTLRNESLMRGMLPSEEKSPTLRKGTKQCSFK